VTIGDFNGDGMQDAAFALYGENNISILFGEGNGTFNGLKTLAAFDNYVGLAVADLNMDGVLDILGGGGLEVFIGHGDGTFEAGTTIAFLPDRQPIVGDYDGDGIPDVAGVSQVDGSISIARGRGDGTFETPIVHANGFRCSNILAADLDSDGVLDFAGTNYTGNKLEVMLGTTRELTTMQKLNLSTVENAQAAMLTLAATADRVSRQQGALAASESRLSHADDFLNVLRENSNAALATITDIDVAEEIATLVRTQIIEQGATAVLAQANQSADLVLQLLSEYHP